MRLIIWILWVLGVTKYVGLTEYFCKGKTMSEARMRVFTWPFWMLKMGFTAVMDIIAYFRGENHNDGGLF